MKLLVNILVAFLWQASSLSVPGPTEVNQNKNDFTNLLGDLFNFDSYVQNSTDQLLNSHYDTVNEKVDYVNQRLRGIATNNNYSNQEIIQKCVSDKQLLQIQANEINEQIKRCATIVQAQYVNVMSTSYNDVQVFVSFATVIWGEIKKCGLNDSCRWNIVLDAINEAGQLPSKVFALASKIQTLVLKTITAINSCAIDGMKKVNAASLNATEQIFVCIASEASSNIQCSNLK